MKNSALHQIFSKFVRPLAVLLLAFILVSAVKYGPTYASPDFYKDEISFLDARRNTVLLLVASSSAASAVITLIPDDVGTPIAEQLADLSSAFTFILAVLLAEKYLLPILGGFTVTIMIPAICVVSIIYLLFFSPRWLKNMLIKFSILSLAFITIIPLSIHISKTIEKTFEVSINNTINTALESEEKLNVEQEQDQNIWQRITGAVSNTFDYIGKAVNIAKETLGNFADAVAVSLVICCVIPLLVLLTYLAIIKYVFGLNFSIQDSARETALRYKQYRRKAFKQKSLEE